MIVDARINGIVDSALNDVVMQEESSSINFIIKEMPANVKQGGISTKQNHGFSSNPSQDNLAKGAPVGIPLMSHDIEMLKKKKEILDQELQEVARQLKSGLAGMKRSLSEADCVEVSEQI
ncbi:hypothetical protein L7F22_068635 [Adiantum nelumboides]|nr:hypothetical protein [Adiantum nelumboides]